MINSLRNPMTAVIIFLIQAMQGIILGSIFRNQYAKQTTSTPIPLFSKDTWNNNIWVDRYLHGSEVDSFLSAYEEGIGPDQSYILFNKFTPTSETQSSIIFLLNEYSSCLYNKLNIPNKGYINATQFTETPATSWDNWTAQHIYINLISLYQIFDYKYSIGETHDTFDLQFMKECLKENENLPLNFYFCLMRKSKPHLDPFLECAGMPPLPQLSETSDSFPMNPPLPNHTGNNGQINQLQHTIEYDLTKLPYYSTIYALLQQYLVTPDNIDSLFNGISEWLNRSTSGKNQICYTIKYYIDKSIDYFVKASEGIYAALHLTGCLFFLTTILGFASYDALLSFPQERCLFNRETSDGYYRPFNYYVAKNLTDILLQCGPSLVMAIIYYFLVEFDTNFLKVFTFLFICLFTIFCGYGFGYMISAASPRMEIALVFAPLLLVIWLVISGFFLREQDVPLWIRWFKYFSFYRWSYFSFAINQFPPTSYFGLYSNKFLLSAMGVQQTSLTFSMGILILMGCFYRILGYFFLIKTNRLIGLES